MNDKTLLRVREQLDKPLSELGIKNCIRYVSEGKGVAETALLLESNNENFATEHEESGLQIWMIWAGAMAVAFFIGFMAVV